MLKAIHKKSGKVISSFKVENDLYWNSKKEDEWIAPYYEVSNWKEIKERGIKEVPVSFIKQHTRKIGEIDIRVLSHFRINCEHAQPSYENESELHKISKDAIYEEILNDSILINNLPISRIVEIEDIEIEYRLSKNKASKVADVCTIFKEFHPLYGKGIIFEIQLSNQTEEKTDERTFYRVAEGFSVVWIFEKDINSNGKLRNNNITPLPFLDAINEYQNKIKNESLENLELIKTEFNKKYFQYQNRINLLEEKSEEINKRISKDYSSIKNWVEEQTDSLLALESNILGELNVEKDKITTQAESELQQIKMNILDSIRNNPQIIEKIIANVDLSNISEKIKERVINEAIEKVGETIKGNINNQITNHLENNFNSEKIKEIVNELKTNSSIIINNSIKELNKALLDKINYKGKYVIKCGGCKRDVRLSSTEFNGAIICKECSSKGDKLDLTKIVNEQEKYSKLQREVYND